MSNFKGFVDTRLHNNVQDKNTKVIDYSVKKTKQNINSMLDVVKIETKT